MASVPSSSSQEASPIDQTIFDIIRVACTLTASQEQDLKCLTSSGVRIQGLSTVADPYMISGQKSNRRNIREHVGDFACMIQPRMTHSRSESPN